MRAICRLYVKFCGRCGPRIEGKRATVSAWAWHRAQETGDTFWRDRIDGAFLLFLGQHNHTQSCFQRERANHDDAKGPRK